MLAYGCDMGEDEEFFYGTYEECDITCSGSMSLGDLNNDSNINVVDIVLLVNIILQSESYNQTGDMNFDNLSNVIDVVNLVNIILTNSDTRDTWQIINEDIITPKCAMCHYEGSFYAELSDLILTQDIAYQQMINRIPDNQSAATNGLQLLSDEGGLLGLLLSYFWEKININNETHFYSEHPPILEMDPPLTINSNHGLIARTTWNNTTDDWVNFGLFSTDEMMIVFGLVYFD